MEMNEKLAELAQAVLEVLDAQQEYFKHRDSNQFAHCMQIESRLRKRCKEILSPNNEQPTLF